MSQTSLHKRKSYKCLLSSRQLELKRICWRSPDSSRGITVTWQKSLPVSQPKLLRLLSAFLALTVTFLLIHILSHVFHRSLTLKIVPKPLNCNHSRITITVYTGSIYDVFKLQYSTVRLGPRNFICMCCQLY